MIRVVELFAGIGSQRMALTLAGIPYEVVAISEIDRHALASYEAIWGDCPNLGDIRDIEGLPPCDLVTYSFPCQDLSIAGKREGMAEGTRSGLVWEVVRLLEAMPDKPEWLLMENVPQALTSPLWGVLVGRLQSMGYYNRWANLDSSDFGSAQKRIRAFMVSRKGRSPPNLPIKVPNAPLLCFKDIMEPTRDPRFILNIPVDRIKWRESKPFEENTVSIAKSNRIKVLADWDRDNRIDVANRLYSPLYACPTIVTHSGGNHEIKVLADDSCQSYRHMACLYSDMSKCPTLDCLGRHGKQMIKIISDGDAETLRVNTLTPLECWRLMGQPYWAYKRASAVCSETQLYNLAGNSIVVEVLESIFRAMFPASSLRQLTLEEVVA